MIPLAITARRAGLLYLAMAACAPFSLLWVPLHFVVPGDGAATLAAIRDGEVAYRCGLVAGVATNIIFACLGLTLYELLHGVDRRLARLMVALVMLGATVGLVNQLPTFAPLLMIGDARALSGFSQAQIETAALVAHRLRSAGDHLGMFFWALWLVPFGMLVIRSQFIPRVLGRLLIVGGAAYLTVALTFFLWPAMRADVNRLASPLYALGELAMSVWLLTRGPRIGSAHRAQTVPAPR